MPGSSRVCCRECLTDLAFREPAILPSDISLIELSNCPPTASSSWPFDRSPKLEQRPVFIAVPVRAGFVPRVQFGGQSRQARLGTRYSVSRLPALRARFPEVPLTAIAAMGGIVNLDALGVKTNSVVYRDFGRGQCPVHDSMCIRALPASGSIAFALSSQKCSWKRHTEERTLLARYFHYGIDRQSHHLASGTGVGSNISYSPNRRNSSPFFSQTSRRRRPASRT